MAEVEKYFLQIVANLDKDNCQLLLDDSFMLLPFPNVGFIPEFDVIPFTDGFCKIVFTPFLIGLEVEDNCLNYRTFLEQFKSIFQLRFCQLTSMVVVVRGYMRGGDRG